MSAERALARDLLRLVAQAQAEGTSTYFALALEQQLTLSQLRALALLAEAGRELTIRGLAAEIPLSVAATSRLIETLLIRGWVSRREDPDDRRHRLVALSDDGRRLLRRLNQRQAEGLAELLAELDGPQQAALRQLLRALDALR